MSERDLIDLTVKQYTRPQLVVNNFVLGQKLKEIRRLKHSYLKRLDITVDQLMSDAKFTVLLSKAGLPDHLMPKKYSMAKRKNVSSFAKDNPGFQALLTHEDERIRDLAKARQLFKSTIEETRAETLMTLKGMPKALHRLPAPLLYYGAHTGRFSGRDKMNLQNLGRGSFLREAIVAPKGHKIVAADLAQIEARITALFCGQMDLVEQFRQGIDVYSAFATDVYGFQVSADTHPAERFVGKTGILSLGYQAGAGKFHGTMNHVFSTPISWEDSERVVSTYRGRFKEIKDTWYELHNDIGFMASGRGGYKQRGPVEFHKGKVVLPNGMPIYYPELRFADGWAYITKRHGATSVTKISNNLYGGKLLENIVQALARIVMTQAVDKFYEHNLLPAMSVHDELVFVVKEDRAEVFAAAVKATMEQKVPWMPDLPVKCEANIGDNYAECK